MNSSSTLVATVSINYEDFTEGFLTCGTCLYAYDQSEHTPKLLSCSHTICQSCLELIASSPTLNNNTEAGCIKCPICRQNILIPSGGIGALPPSFLVNQLFDLVNKKPREFIPKCSIHIEQELLFCETCDCVFCDTCNSSNDVDDNLTVSSLNTATTGSIATATSHSNSVNTSRQQQQQKSQNNKQHINEVCTVIPFATAIKRMSEILNYRTQQCSIRLDEARDNVQREIDKLESNCTDATRDIGLAFEKIKSIIDEREKVLLEETEKLREFKKNVLLEQLRGIENEKSNLNSNNSVKINNETDVKNLSKKIGDLTEKNDAALALFTPRENCFICYETENDEALDNLKESINVFGKLRTSRTYPPNCISTLIQCSTHLRSTVIVESVDYDGLPQKIGGDPIQAVLKLVGCNEDIDGAIEISDKRDGTYEVAFVPPVAGKYELYIYIFNRPIKNCPLTFETTSHHNPVAIFGSSSKKGVADNTFDSFSQPAGLAINKHNGRVYIIDSFNSRIKVLAQIDSKECPFSFMQHVTADFFGRSCTGIALLYPEEDERSDEHGIQALSLSPTRPPNPNILVTDWRNRSIFELNNDGKLLRQFTHQDLQEPTNIVVDSRGRIFVVDRESIFVFDSLGKLLQRLTGYKYHSSRQEACNAKSRANQLVADESQKPPLNILQANNDSVPTMSPNNDASDHQFQQQQQNKESQNNGKPLTATLNTYLVNSLSPDKRQNIKTNTLSSLISLKRKPKLHPNSSLQRGSKAVMSAASRIRSTFTLSHSTSLVSAASLQSMFNSNKNNSMNNNHVNQQNLDNHSVGLSPNGGGDSHQQQQLGVPASNNGKLKANKHAAQYKQLQTAISEQIENSNVSLIDSGKQSAEISDAKHSEAGKPSAGQDPIEPFGIIRGIAIGPNDELIVADESRVRVLEPGDEYLFKRELLMHHHRVVGGGGGGGGIGSPIGGICGGATMTGCCQANAVNSATSSGRLCGMTYDSQHGLLLILRINSANSGSGGIPLIQIVDYSSGREKFTIDSFEFKLIRPSSLATYGAHVIVTDLGNDCIKKFRFY